MSYLNSYEKKLVAAGLWQPLAKILANPADTDKVASGNVGGGNSVIIPEGWGANWKIKLAAAKAGTGLASIAFVGDSVTLGQYCSNLDTTSLPGLIRIALQASYGNGGSGYKSVYDSVQSLNNATYTSSVAAASLIALTGTWVQSTTSTDGPGAGRLDAQATGSTATYVAYGTTIKTYVLKGTSAGFGHYTVTIDDVVSATFNSGSQASVGVQVQTFTGLSAGAHTVVITAGISETLSSSLQVFFCGIQGLNDSGVIVNKYARGSYPTAAFNNSTGGTFYTSANVATGGAGQGSIALSGQWSGGSANPADLIIYSMGLNDSKPAGHTTTPDDYIKNIYLYLSDVREGNPSADIVIMLQHGGDPAFSDTTRYYANYAERLQSLAATFNAVFIDFWKLGHNSWAWMQAQGYMSDSAGAAGIAGTNQVHLSDAGYAWQATRLLPVLKL